MPRLPYLKCPECERPSIGGRTHPRCQKRFGIDGVLSFYPYKGVVKQAIKGIKYKFAYRIAEDVLQMISEEQLIFLKHMILVPIPLHSSRLQMRGFNQAEIIATILSKKYFLPIQINILKRVQKTPPQVEMRYRKERIENMKKVFAVSKTYQLKKTAILLVDDVFTTGATMRSAAESLKKAGAETVWGVTIAQ